jgi:Na+-translocating ferredoxin:NAD+ oxidoreductase RnfD subunit
VAAAASNGAVLLFAFFMISDPMTTPQQRSARITYAVAVAWGHLSGSTCCSSPMA